MALAQSCCREHTIAACWGVVSHDESCRPPWAGIGRGRDARNGTSATQPRCLVSASPRASQIFVKPGHVIRPTLRRYAPL
eukprot:9594357-Alexandrium_andersonii.AAC.1